MKNLFLKAGCLALGVIQAASNPFDRTSINPEVSYRVGAGADVLAQPAAASKYATDPEVIKKVLIGSWDWTIRGKDAGWVVFGEDGLFVYWGENSRWKVSSGGTITVTRPNRETATFRLRADLQGFAGTDFRSQPVIAKRRLK